MEAKIAKIGVSESADDALDQMLTKVNEGFTGGRVSKNDLASWIVLRFESQSFDSSLEKIRKDHFDNVAYLESVVQEMKQARRKGAAVPDVNALLVPVVAQIKTISARKKLRSNKAEGPVNE